jgi:cobalt/nickel transport system permease protein
MTDRWLLAVWLVAVVAATFIHDPPVLAALVGLVLVAQPRSAARIAGRAMLAVAFVNLAVSVAWIAQAEFQNQPWGELVLRLNLRVLLIAALTFSMIQRVDLVRAVDFWPALRFVAVLALGQLRVLDRLLDDYRAAYTSRSPTSPRLRLRFAASGRQAAALIDKAEQRSQELNQGMRARGFFDDRG